jgi:hypothetical protein
LFIFAGHEKKIAGHQHYKIDVGIMGHLSSSVNFLGCDYWKKARFMVLHNKDMEILKIKLFQ